MELVVSVKQGKLRGKIQKDRNEKQFFSFLGIPYAKPPLGTLRFKAPQEPDNWEGIRDATTPGNIAYGVHDASTSECFKVEEKGFEDCLYLNVYTRQLPKQGDNLKPVMFWIHGGGFVNGTGHPDLYGPELLICEDIVLVTINYRLGIFGFLSLEDPALGIPGNAGLKDMVQALKWVKENVKKFNGDPNNVTIFGESAGGAAIHYLVLSPLAKGLFHKAIIQSGSALSPWAKSLGNSEHIAKLLGIRDEKQMMEKMQKMTPEEVYDVQKKVGDIISVNNYRRFVPIVEKSSVKDAFITEEPFDLMLSGRYNQVPVMIGYTSKESYSFPFFKEVKLLDVELDVGTLLELPPYIKIDKNSKEYKDLCSKIKQLYFGNGEIVVPSDGYYDLMSDHFISRDVYLTGKAFTKTMKCPVYFYTMSIDTELNLFKKFAGITLPGAAHADEEFYLFQSTLSPKVTKGSAEDLGIERFCKLWANFAKTNNPVVPNQEVLKGVTWPPATQKSFNYLDIGQELKLGKDPDAERMATWEKIIEKR